jgi:hypothetical protein
MNAVLDNHEFYWGFSLFTANYQQILSFFHYRHLIRLRIRILLSLSKNSKKNIDSYCFVTSL